MIKKILFSVLALCLMTSLQAQNDAEGVSVFDDAVDDVYSRSYTIAIGPKAGLNFTTMSDPDNISLEQKNGIGFAAGLAANFHFGRRTEGSRGGTGYWGLQIEALYNQKTVKSDYDDMKFSYFEVPILAQYYFTPNIYVEAGPTICGTISSSPDNLSVDNVSIAVGDIKGFDVAMSVGVGYKHKSGFMANARYNIGTSELAENFTGKLNSFCVSVGWLFTIVK